MAYVILTHCLDDPQLVAFLQAEYATNNDYRVLPVREMGGIRYRIMNGAAR